MKQKQGYFYFISDEFYRLFDKEQRLMKNKETIDGVLHGRPCFYAFEDNRTPGILWCVPVSSKLKKYEDIYAHKIERQREKGVERPMCNTIYFAEIMGIRRAFLIQNMFPITNKYIASMYMDRNTQRPVTIEPGDERAIVSNARDVIRLVFGGNTRLVFSDIITTYKNLCAELGQERESLTSETPAKKPSFIADIKQRQAEIAKRDRERKSGISNNKNEPDL